VAGFKASVQSFAELAAPGESGLGTAAIGTRVLFTQGKLARSGGPFDLAIEGPGFLRVVDARGRRAYTRDGSFARAADGTLRNAAGWRLDGVRIPPDALRASVASDGAVTATFASGTRAVGRIRIAEFPSPEHLRATGGTLFEATADAGPVSFATPGKDGGPQLRFGMLEQSNVSIVESMMGILRAQRAYEADAKGVQAADEMLRIANNLQRG
ncbi:MAG TPA: flagellar hook basal-body protein, partial [Verrucomicrobiae bacterium]|nr:flagellar hook basal-body protein [Verrucomicrobiae bacterium]